jgi:succinate dehydrogenase / fumarate reductase, cytochrome b subunit
MGWFIKFIDSSVGKKLVMALTGLFLYFYLIIHLVANLLLLLNDGGEAFNAYADFMSSGVNIPIRIIEIILFLAFAYHILNGVRIWISNKKSKGTDYKMNNPSENSSFFSRFMFWSGTIVFIFLVIHLRTFFVRYKFGQPEESMYDAALIAFSDTYYSLFYIVAMILLAFHLVHGFQSGFQTLGLRHNKYTSFIKGFGVVFSILLCAGFALIPLVLLLKSGGGN